MEDHILIRVMMVRLKVEEVSSSLRVCMNWKMLSNIKRMTLLLITCKKKVEDSLRFNIMKSKKMKLDGMAKNHCLSN
jgi:hypothetical protein